MLGVDAQKRLQETLRQIDAALVADSEQIDAIGRQRLTFRDTLFGAFQHIERECLQLKALLIQLRRLDANQLQVQSKGRPAFIVLLDPEPAFDRKAAPPAESEARPAESNELAARVFAVLAPPARGLLRYYSIFSDGSWKRSVLVGGSNGVVTQQALVARFNDEMLTLEAADLLGQAVMAHASWANLAPDAEHLGFEALRDHAVTRAHPLGVSGGSGGSGGPRLRKLGSGSLKESGH
jgi:hypothetical protein